MNGLYILNNFSFSKKPGIIIEYPPGVNPIYNDGVLTLEK